MIFYSLSGFSSDLKVIRSSLCGIIVRNEKVLKAYFVAYLIDLDIACTYCNAMPRFRFACPLLKLPGQGIFFACLCFQNKAVLSAFFFTLKSFSVCFDSGILNTRIGENCGLVRARADMQPV